MPDKEVILDTNILYAGLYSSKGYSHNLLRYIFNRKVVIALSTALLFEYEEILTRDKRKLGLSKEKINIILDNLCALGSHYKINFLWRPFLKDPKDDHILELAVSAGCSSIVTFNTRDFKGCEQFNVRVVHPRSIVEELS